MIQFLPLGWETEYSYYNPTEGQTTVLVSDVNHKTLGLNLNYVYDKFGNIVAIKENGTLKASYEYDNLHQLTRENNTYTNKTVVYDYDNGGNILTKTEYDFTTGSLDGLTGTVVQYTYGDTEWKDLLTAYNGQTITYDEIGNPLSYRDGMVFSWSMGRQLHTVMTPSKSDIAYRYNAEGIRVQKRVEGVITVFVLDDTDIIAQKQGNNIIWYTYDVNGQRHSMTYGGQTYYYYYNAQGDVVGLYDSALNSVVQYTYDSWGKVLSVTGSMADTLGQANPFRYRGYYYDTETGLYYLNSRYYDPEVGRFINADVQISGVGGEVLGYNMFAYCFNNPVNMYDDTGEWPKWLVNLFGGKKKIQALNPAEQKFVYKYPFDANTFNKCATKALQLTVKWFKDSSDGTMANAFQHAYWNALMVFRVNKNKASKFATAHESYTEAQLNRKDIGGLRVRDLTNMDLWNNYVGREIGQSYKNAYKARRKGVYILGGYWTIDRKNPEGQLADIVWWATVMDGYTYWLR